MKRAVAAVIAALHAGALYGLFQLSVIGPPASSARPITVELIPLAPPPPAPAPPSPALQRRPVVPIPIIETPQPRRQIVAVADPPPAVFEPRAEVGPPTVAASGRLGSPAAPPITPPDAYAEGLDNPAPRYPYDARRRREQGTVVLRVTVTAEGLVSAIAVARSSGHALLDRAALTTVRRWRFRPAQQAGVAVAAEGWVDIPFVLTGK